MRRMYSEEQLNTLFQKQGLKSAYDFDHPYKFIRAGQGDIWKQATFDGPDMPDGNYLICINDGSNNSWTLEVPITLKKGIRGGEVAVTGFNWSLIDETPVNISLTFNWDTIDWNITVHGPDTGPINIIADDDTIYLYPEIAVKSAEVKLEPINFDTPYAVGQWNNLTATGTFNKPIEKGLYLIKGFEGGFGNTYISLVYVQECDGFSEGFSTPVLNPDDPTYYTFDINVNATDFRVLDSTGSDYGHGLWDINLYKLM